MAKITISSITPTIVPIVTSTMQNIAHWHFNPSCYTIPDVLCLSFRNKTMFGNHDIIMYTIGSNNLCVRKLCGDYFRCPTGFRDHENNYK